MHSCRVRDISVNFLSYGGDVLAKVGPFETFYAVVIPLSGKVVASQRVCVASGRAFVVSPDNRVETRWTAECRALIVRIEQTALEARLSELTGGPLREPLRFDGSLLETAVKARVFAHHLVTLLLEIQSHNYADALDLVRGGLCSVPRDEVTVDRSRPPLGRYSPRPLVRAVP